MKPVRGANEEILENTRINELLDNLNKIMSYTGKQNDYDSVIYCTLKLFKLVQYQNLKY